MHIYTLLAIVFCFFPSFVMAQFNDNFSQKQLSINLNPQYPSPGETVTVSLDDYSLGSTNQTVNWSINKKMLIDAKNKRSFTFTPTEPLTSYTINVGVATADNQTLTATATLIPRYLDIIIEPQTYTPKWHRGRALPTTGSLIRATALLHSNNGPVNNNDYTYVWRLNNTVLNGGGSLGQYQTVYTTPIGRSHLLSVDILDKTGNVVSKKVTVVQTSEVETVLYEISPLYGINTQKIGASLSMIGNSLTLQAIPFNLDLRAFSENLFTEWQIDSKKVPLSDNPFIITLNRNGVGQSEINFKLRNRESLLQGDDVSTRLEF